MEVKHYGKKITSIALVAALAAGMTAIPASAEQYNSAMSAPNRMSTVQPRTASWTVTGDWVRMRREPSLLGEIIMLLQYGETVYEGTEYSHVEAAVIHGFMFIQTVQAGAAGSLLHLWIVRIIDFQTKSYCIAKSNAIAFDT